MKILMFGWEFPPHITGGLGTASYGLVKGLLKQGADVTFVVPKAYGDEDRDIKLVNASDVTVNIFDEHFKEHQKNLHYIEINSRLVPYQTPEEYFRLLNIKENFVENIGSSVFAEKYEFSGKYGDNILEEVKRYALIATEIDHRDK
ncbi:MAG TPA: glycosyltransferase family 1 protein, partial [Saprospiraceae bacterium]|nr:glycosyltransferase family 1 protein [Saprospiraceae bacterium]